MISEIYVTYDYKNLPFTLSLQRMKKCTKRLSNISGSEFIFLFSLNASVINSIDWTLADFIAQKHLVFSFDKGEL